jgi:hypothetical protein
LDKVPEGDEARCFGNAASRFGTKSDRKQQWTQNKEGYRFHVAIAQLKGKTTEMPADPHAVVVWGRVPGNGYPYPISTAFWSSSFELDSSVFF